MFHWGLIIIHWGLIIIGGVICLGSLGTIGSDENKDDGSKYDSYWGLLVAALIIWGGTAIPLKASTPPPPPPPQTELTLENWNLKVVGADRPGQNLVWGIKKAKKASGTWLVVETLLTNVGTEDVSLHPSSFRLRDYRGAYYEHYADLPIAEVYELYHGGQLMVDRVVAPGATLHHHLIFDVSVSEVNIFNLEFKPNVFKEGKYLEVGAFLGKKSANFGDKAPPPLAWNSWELTTVGIEQPGKSLKWLGSEKAIEASGQWLVVDIAATNKSGRNSVIHPFDFKLRDEQGNAYVHYPDLTVTEVYERYRNKDLMINQIVKNEAVRRHFLLFDIPIDSTSFKLEFAPDVFAQAKSYKLEPLRIISSPDTQHISS